MIDRAKLVSEMHALIALGPYQGFAAERIMQCMKDAAALLLADEALENSKARLADATQKSPAMPKEGSGDDHC